MLDKGKQRFRKKVEVHEVVLKIVLLKEQKTIDFIKIVVLSVVRVNKVVVFIMIIQAKEVVLKEGIIVVIKNSTVRRNEWPELASELILKREESRTLSWELFLIQK